MIERLNPWIIDIEKQSDYSVRINIISNETGEIKQINLEVDDINAISILEMERIRKLAEIVYDEDLHSEKLRVLNNLSDYSSNEDYSYDDEDD